MRGRLAKRALNNLRYSYFFSTSILPFARFLLFLAERTSNFVKKKIKVNQAVVNYWGYTIRFPKHTGQGILSNIYWYKEYGFERWTSQVLIHYFKMSNTFVDVGANFGFYSVLASKSNPSIKIIAFEPLQYNFNMLEKFTSVNKVENITLYRYSCSDSKRKDTIFYPHSLSPQELTTASLDQDFFYNKKYSKTKEEGIECVRLDEIEEFSNIHNILIKIDVEGHEWETIKGAKKVIADKRPVIVCEITTNRKLIYEYMSSQKYIVLGITKVGLIRMTEGDFMKNQGFRDYLFMPEERGTWKENLASITELP